MNPNALTYFSVVAIIVIAEMLELWLHVSADGIIASAALAVAVVALQEARHD